MVVWFRPNYQGAIHVKQACLSFWYPTPESRAAMELPFGGARFKAGWKASWRWPVIWRRFLVVFVAIQLWNVGYLAVRGFQTVALERQRQAAGAAAMAGLTVKFDALPDDKAPEWKQLSDSYADAIGMSANERAQRIARYCKWLGPQEWNEAELFFSTSEEIRILKRFKCSK
jgi:hypothetical protein